MLDGDVEWCSRGGDVNTEEESARGLWIMMLGWKDCW